MIRGGVNMKIPERLDKLPGELARRHPKFMLRVAELMAAEVGRQAPGGRGGRIGRSFRGEADGLSGSRVVSSHPGAKALDVGAYIRPRHAGRGKRRPVIRFQGSGGAVYRPAVRVKARRYTSKAASRRRKVIHDAFQDVYG